MVTRTGNPARAESGVSASATPDPNDAAAMTRLEEFQGSRALRGARVKFSGGAIVTRDEFEQVYEANYTKALNAARRVNPAYAEDAVSDAAVYLLENLGRFQYITPSYFIQACMTRVLNQIRNQHHDTVLPVGTVHDLAMVEYVHGERNAGRAFNSETKLGKNTGDVLVGLPGEEPKPPRVVRGRVRMRGCDQYDRFELHLQLGN